MKITPQTWPAILTAATLAFISCFLLPLELLLLNQGEFGIGILDLASRAWLPLCAAIVFGAAIGWFRPGISSHIVAFIVVLTLGITLQSQFFKWDFGTFDGHDIKWSDFFWRGWGDGLVWIILLLTAVLLPRTITKHAGKISIFTLVIHLSSLAGPLLYGPVRRSAPEVKTVSTSPFFRFSGTHNVVVIMLDAFAAPAFEEILKEDPMIARRFNGFTSYSDTLAAFATTSPSIPAILTGQTYDNKITMPEFMTRAFDAGLPNKLATAGYEVGLTTFPHYCKYVKNTACLSQHQIASDNTENLKFEDLARLADISLFRAAPTWLKPSVMNDQQWTFQQTFGTGLGTPIHIDSLGVVDAIERYGKVGTEAPVFKFIHLFVPHIPVQLDENCNFLSKPLKLRSSGFLDQGRCALKLADRIFDVLKKARIYDEALVLVIADHGARVSLVKNFPRKQVQQQLGLSHPELALPLLMVKPSGASGPLKFESPQSSVIDISPTMADLLSIPYDSPGTSIFKLDSVGNRTRTFKDYKWKHEFWDGDFLPPMQEYIVEGPSRELKSWRKGQTFSPSTEDSALQRQR